MEDSDIALETRAEALVEDHEQMLRMLVAHRREHELSQDLVAERMGVTQPTVAAFERYDSNPTLASIRRYAMAVGVRLHTRVIDDWVERPAKSDKVIHLIEAVEQRDDVWADASALLPVAAAARSRGERV